MDRANSHTATLSPKNVSADAARAEAFTRHRVTLHLVGHKATATSYPTHSRRVFPEQRQVRQPTPTLWEDALSVWESLVSSWQSAFSGQQRESPRQGLSGKRLSWKSAFSGQQPGRHNRGTPNWPVTHFGRDRAGERIRSEHFFYGKWLCVRLGSVASLDFSNRALYTAIISMPCSIDRGRRSSAGRNRWRLHGSRDSSSHWEGVSWDG